MYRTCKLHKVLPKRTKPSGSNVAAMAVRRRRMFSTWLRTSRTKFSPEGSSVGKSTGAPRGFTSNTRPTSLSSTSRFTRERNKVGMTGCRMK